MKEIILQVISTLVQTTIFYLCLILLGSKATKVELTKKVKLISATALLITSIPVLIIRNFYQNITFLNTFLYLTTMFLILNKLLKVNPLKSILISLSVLVIMFISEIMAAFTGMVIFHMSSAEINQNIILNFIVIMMECMFALIIWHIIKIITNKPPKLPQKLIANTSNNYVLNILIVFIICIMPQFVLFYFYKYDYPVSILIVNTLQIILVCVVLFSYFKTIMEKEKAKSDLEISELHNKTMIGMVDGVRTLKHDYNNIMQALNGYVSTKQYDKLQEHINKVLDECNIVNNLSVIDQKVFNDPAIYGIVGAKYFIAMEADIKFELDIVTNIKEISFPMPELSRILGIVLDNAIEATSKTDNKYMKLEMKYDARKDADIIKVYNTYDTNIDINLKDIYKKGVSSKKVKSGIGLWEVKKLIDKSKNSQIYASLEHDMFVQNIIIEKVIN